MGQLDWIDNLAELHSLCASVADDVNVQRQIYTNTGEYGSAYIKYIMGERSTRPAPGRYAITPAQAAKVREIVEGFDKEIRPDLKIQDGVNF